MAPKPKKTTLLKIESPLLDCEKLRCKQMLTVDEAAVYTGMSKAFIYVQTSPTKRPKDSMFPRPEKIGSRVMFRRADLDKFLGSPASTQAAPLRRKVDRLAGRLGLTTQQSIELAVNVVDAFLDRIEKENQDNGPPSLATVEGWLRDLRDR